MRSQTLASPKLDTRIDPGSLDVQTALNKAYQFTHSDRVDGTFNGHRIYMSTQGVACRDCGHGLGVPSLIRAADPATQIVYRLYLFGKLIDERCKEHVDRKI